MQLRARWTILPLAATALLASPSALADAPDGKAPVVHVLRVASEDADAQSEALTLQLRSGVRALHGWTLGGTDFSLEVLSLALQCGEIPDARCQAKIADHIHADRYVWGTLKKGANRQVTADLHLWSRDGTTATARVTYSDNLTVAGDDALRRIAAQALNELTGGPPKGEVVVRTGADGDLFVDGQAAGSAAGRRVILQLAPGEHRIELRQGGQTIESGSVSVLADGGHVEIALAPKKADAAPAPAREEPETPGEPGAWRRTAGWIGVGAGGALVATGVYGLVKVQSIQHESGFDAYRKGFSSGQDVCAAAQAGVTSSQPGASSPADVASQCSSASTALTLQWVGFGVGALATGAGIYFLATAPSRPESGAASAGRFAIAPSLGPRGGGATLRVAF